MPFITQGKINWKFLLIVIILAIVVGVGAFMITRQEFPIISSFVFPKSCQSIHDSIEKEFEEANFCTQDSDCKTMSLGGQYITFGCYKFVNKLTNEQTLYDKMEKYYQKCTSPIDECMPTPESVCVNNKCTKKTEDEITKEKACLNSGGTVLTVSCCKSASDFPNSCLIGACGCSSDNSHQVKTCYCGEGKCFDGEKCSSQETSANGATIRASIPFHNSIKVLQLFSDLRLVVYNSKTSSSVFLGKLIPQVSYTGNSGAFFMPIAITKDDSKIILDAEMGSPGAGGGLIDYGYSMISIKPASDVNFVISDFPFIATRSAHFYDSFGKVIYVDEGANSPHYSKPGPSNNGSIKFRDLITNDSETLLEETDTGYEIVNLYEDLYNVLYFKATRYSFSEQCPREEDALYCAEKTTTERYIKLP